MRSPGTEVDMMRGPGTGVDMMRGHSIGEKYLLHYANMIGTISEEGNKVLSMSKNVFLWKVTNLPLLVTDKR